MRLRAALGMALAGLTLAAPTASAALAPPPTVLDFEAFPVGPLDDAAYSGAGVTLNAEPDGEGFCGGSEGLAAAAPLTCATVDNTGHDSERSLLLDGNGSLIATFAAPQASVSMWVASSSSFDNVTVEAWSGLPEQSTLIERLPLISSSSPFGRAAVLQSALGRADIGSVRVFTDGLEMSVDDITFSPVASPDTEIISGPAAVSRSTDASFVFAGNQPDTRFDCSLDGAVAVSCRPPYNLSGLGSDRIR